MFDLEMFLIVKYFLLWVGKLLKSLGRDGVIHVLGYSSCKDTFGKVYYALACLGIKGTIFFFGSMVLYP